MYDTYGPTKADCDAEAAAIERDEIIVEAIKDSQKHTSITKLMEDLDNSMDALEKMYKKDKRTEEYITKSLEAMQESYDKLEEEADFMVTTESVEYKEIDENYP